MPEKALLNHAYTDMSAEQVYNQIIEDQIEVPKDGFGADLLEPESSGDQKDTPGGLPIDEVELDNELKTILVRAQQQDAASGDRQAGRLPASLLRLLDSITKTQVTVESYSCSFSKYHSS